LKKWQLALLIILALFLGLSFLPLFPDPDYHFEKVNFWEWLKREIHKLLHGEKD
jgi:hypothetical protein